jgi:hypothetical protein
MIEWPQSDAFVGWRPGYETLIYACGGHLYDWPNKKKLLVLSGMSSIEYIRWNRTADKFIIGDKDRAWIVDYRTFRRLERFDATVAWWGQDNSLCYIHPRSSDPEDGQVLRIGSKKHSIPPETYITAGTENGTYFLARAYDKRKPFEKRGKLILLGSSGSQGILRHVKKLIHEEPLTEYPYGDFVVHGEETHDLVFGIGRSTDKDRSSTGLYYYKLGSAAPTEVWQDMFSYTLHPCYYNHGTYRGIRWKIARRGEEFTNRIYYYRYNLSRGKSVYTPFRGNILYYAVHSQLDREAYLVHLDGKILLITTQEKRLRSVEILEDV